MGLLRTMVKQVALATTVLVAQRIAAKIVDKASTRLQRPRLPQPPQG
jgi:hypothetical protein